MGEKTEKKNERTNKSNGGYIAIDWMQIPTTPIPPPLHIRTHISVHSHIHKERSGGAVDFLLTIKTKMFLFLFYSFSFISMLNSGRNKRKGDGEWEKVGEKER